MITLYRKNKLGIGTWRIWSEGATIVMAHANVNGGQEVVHRETVDRGLAGRTLEEQVASRIQSRVNRQHDRGYRANLQHVMESPLRNMLNLPPPMLAKKLDDMRGWPGKVAAQPKLDGFRCLVTRDPEGQVICYSRQGKVLEALSHIAESVGPHLDDDTILDGEIYQHGKPLQLIASLAKRKQKGTENLVYHVYDSVSHDPFTSRYDEAELVVRKARTDKVVMVPTTVVPTMEQVWHLFEMWRTEGYEGAMIRTLAGPYESGTRSSHLIKVKARDDAEFKVIDVIPGSDGLGILVCHTQDGKTFKTLAPGDHSQKKFTLVHKDQYIGRLVTVEYANLTNDGIPFHAVATKWREEL